SAGPEPTIPPEETRLTVGTISGAHGVRGELKMRLATDDPEHLATIKRVFVGEEAKARRLLGIRFHAGHALIRLPGVSTLEQIAELRGLPVRIAGSDARPLEAGEHFLYQLIGLEVFDEAGATLGTVTDLIETGANDVLVIAPPGGGKELLLPNHADVVLDVRPKERRMTVRPLVYHE
ncbi:MAG: ribosome maturation factor RimM, partial [Thermomicrobiales bacterium]